MSIEISYGEYSDMAGVDDLHLEIQPNMVRNGFHGDSLRLD
jgi:hypothetical protein